MIKNIFEVGLVGCAGFTCFLLIMAYSGIASEMRDEEGNFRKKRSLKSFFGAALFILFLFGLLYLGNVRLLNNTENTPGWVKLWLNGFGIFFIIHLFDLIVLDYLIVVKWHPRFLKLPDTDYYTSFKPHVDGFVRGIPIGIVASFLCSTTTLVL
jgi:hypothetical protein